MGVISEIRSHPVRFVKNCGLFSCFLTIGLSLGVVGPTLLDFASKTKSDLKLVALILPFRAGGYAAGSFVSGLFYDKIDVQILTAVVMAISAVFTIAIPFITEIWTLLVLFLVVGTCLGLFSAGGNMFVLDLWGKENPPFMQALHFMYGLGAFVAPLLARPFLQSHGSIEDDNEECGRHVDDGDVTSEQPTNFTLAYVTEYVGVFNSTYGTTFNSTSDGVTESEDVKSEVNLVVPFAIIGALSIVNSIFFVAMRIMYPTTKPHPSRSPGTGVGENARNSIEGEASDLSKLPFTGVAAFTGSFSLSGSFSMSNYAAKGDQAPPPPETTGEFSGRGGSLAMRRHKLKELRYLSRQMSINSGSFSVNSHPTLMKSGSVQSAAAKVTKSRPAPVSQRARLGAAKKKMSALDRFSKWCASLNGWKVCVVIMSTLFMHIYYGLEITFGTFVTTFAAKSPLHLETTEGAFITSIFWATFTFWRLPTIFYVEWLGPIKTILFNLIVLLLGNILLVPFGSTYSWALYAGTALVGLGASPIWASMFGLLELFFPVTSGIASSMITASMLGEFVFPTIISGFVSCYPSIFLYVSLFCSVSVVVLFCLITLTCLYKLTDSTLEQIKTNNADIIDSGGFS